MKVFKRLNLTAGYTEEQWKELDEKTKKEYIKDHPNSKYAKQKDQKAPTVPSQHTGLGKGPMAKESEKVADVIKFLDPDIDVKLGKVKDKWDDEIYTTVRFTDPSTGKLKRIRITEDGQLLTPYLRNFIGKDGKPLNVKDKDFATNFQSVVAPSGKKQPPIKPKKPVSYKGQGKGDANHIVEDLAEKLSNVLPGNFSFSAGDNGNGYIDSVITYKRPNGEEVDLVFDGSTMEWFDPETLKSIDQDDIVDFFNKKKGSTNRTYRKNYESFDA